MPGPLPDPRRRRRNAPTIPTTGLPVGGRTTPAPRLPAWVELGPAGRAWWRWAWRTPQAAAWAAGHEGMVARRAALEDDLAALGAVESLDLLDVLGEDARALKAELVRLAGQASHRLAVHREMRELEDRLGLSPKGMASLRWEIVADPPPADPYAQDEVARRRATRRERLVENGPG